MEVKQKSNDRKSDVQSAYGDCKSDVQSAYGDCTSTSSCKNFNETLGCGISCGGDDNPGYYCHPAGDPGKYDYDTSTLDKTYYAYGCVDWSFQSQRLQNAESEYSSKKTNDNVYFGVGSFGNEKDKKTNLGRCIRLKVEGIDRDLIVQNVNSGGDVNDTQFDLQQGDGGFGIFNTCANNPDSKTTYSMYPGTTNDWGNVYGGWNNSEDCKKLPKYPKLYGENPPEDIDNLQMLCQSSFEKKVRLEGGGNPTIIKADFVSCPIELTQVTGMIPIPEKEVIGNIFDNTTDPTKKCGAGNDNSYCLTRMMDCRKPSAAFIDNVNTDNFYSGAKIVQPCGQDGYNRIDNRCGCKNCNC